MSNINIRINKFYENNKTEIKISFISTFVLGLIAHAYGLVNNIFSHDSLNALYADKYENLAKISVGRFVVPLLRLVRGPITIPMIIGLLGLFFLAVAVFLIVKMFNVKSPFLIFLISGLFCTSVSVTASIATYIHEFDVDIFALLLAVSGALLWSRKNTALSFIVSMLLMVLSFGIYQSNVTVISTLMILFIIVRLMNGEEFKKCFMMGIKGVCELALSSAIYYAISKFLPVIMNIETASRTDVFNVSDSLVQHVSLLNSLNAMIFYELERIIHPFSVLPQFFTAAINIILIAAGSITALILVFKLGKDKIKEKLLALALIALLPISIGFIEILTKGTIHELMIFSFWLIPVLIIIIIQKLVHTGFPASKVISVISFICVAVTIWNNVLVANTAYLKKDMEQKSTLSIMTRVISDLEKRSDYIVGETKICFINADYKTSNKPGFESVSKIAGLEFTNAIGSPGKEWYYCSYDKYFTYFLNYPINIVDNSFITKEIHDKIMEMPSFPANGYIENYDGVLVIRT